MKPYSFYYITNDNRCLVRIGDYDEATQAVEIHKILGGDLDMDEINKVAMTVFGSDANENLKNEMVHYLEQLTSQEKKKVKKKRSGKKTTKKEIEKPKRIRKIK